MNGINGIDEGDNIRTKAITAFAIPIVGIIFAAAILSGFLSIVGSYPQVVLAQQQNLTGGTNATTSTEAVGGGGQSACTPTQTGGGQNSTNGSTAAGASGGGGGNQSSASNVRMFIEQACTAARNNDMQGVMMQLTMALNALGAGTRENMTWNAGATNATTTY